MTGRELVDFVNAGNAPVVIFTETIESCELQFEKNMVARIIGAKIEDDSVCLKVDETEFYESNKSLEQAMWSTNYLDVYDKKYSEIHDRQNISVVYDELDDLVNIVMINQNELYSEYIKTDPKVAYIEWLEQLVLELRK